MKLFAREPANLLLLTLAVTGAPLLAQIKFELEQLFYYSTSTSEKISNNRSLKDNLYML